MEMIITIDKNYDIKQCKYMYSLRIRDYFECMSAFFFKKSLFKTNKFRNAIRAPNSLDPDQVPYFGGSDLGSKCLQCRRYHAQS